MQTEFYHIRIEILFRSGPACQGEFFHLISEDNNQFHTLLQFATLAWTFQHKSLFCCFLEQIFRYDHVRVK